MTTRSAQHGTIRLERRYKASPARVFAAWAESEARAKWDVPGRWVIAEQTFDFREGGREVKRFGPKGDPLLVADTLYLDGHDDAGAREHGTRALFDNLEAALKREAKAA